MNELLGREPVNLDMESVSAFLKDQVVLVTGAGGSIGSELCRQVCRFAPKRLVLVDNAETPLFEIEQELLSNGIPLGVHLCDVADASAVSEAWAREYPNIVLHAAAYKHVPLLERHVAQAIRTNYVGSQNVLAASLCSAHTLVLLSTDKAINPTSVMGATKRATELWWCNDWSTRARMVAVRFGNVVASRGSVVPTFQRQIAAGGPVTVTDQAMRRYFMTIPEAAQLVLQTATMGDTGRIYLLDMGKPVYIVDLAKQMIAESGRDIAIEYTGMRPGERLFEPLDYGETEPTAHPKVFVCPADEKKNWYTLRQLGTECGQSAGALQEAVPEYTPQEQGELA